jgi:hypothetical protein
MTRQPNRFCATALRQYGAIHKQPWAQAHRADLCFVMPGDRANREPRVGIADARVEHDPAACSNASSLRQTSHSRNGHPRFAKRNRVLFSGRSFHDIGDLPARSRQTDPFHAHVNLQLFIH